MDRADLARHWDLTVRELAPLGGGMNSQTWTATTDQGRYVVKAVPAAQATPLANGLALARHVDRAGIATGAPLPTRSGELTARHDGSAVAVLRFVPGRPLTAADQDVIGTTLGRVHLMLRDAVAEWQPFPWLAEDAGHLSVQPWIRPAVSGALRAYRELGTLTTGALHADPAPEAFRLDGGHCGLIDWASAHRGPLLYDLASAVMYVGGMAAAGTLIAAYLETGALERREVVAALPVLWRLRWAVQADYFARRVSTGDLTGVDSMVDNAAGLADACRALTG
ncbi:phosphotransferase [Actinocatenispora sera]|uniref:phosphotransferase enzyme family protein n=1 Tax=Actinocatenispora sera TaxID=390989 RepID=UPI00340068A4